LRLDRCPSVGDQSRQTTVGLDYQTNLYGPLAVKVLCADHIPRPFYCL